MTKEQGIKQNLATFGRRRRTQKVFIHPYSRHGTHFLGQQPCGLNGKTSRPPCCIEGNHHEGDRFRTLYRPGQSTGCDQDCDQNSHRAIVPILQRYAVTSAAFSVPCLKAPSDFGVGDAAVGQSKAIANGFDLLSPIAFAHVFQLDCWPR